MNFNIHHHYHSPATNEVPRWALDLHRKIDLANANLEKFMATLDQVLADVTQESTDLDSIAALIAGLKQQVADALSGATLPPAVQAQVDAVFAGAETNKGKIAAALAANTPPAPPAPPAAG